MPKKFSPKNNNLFVIGAVVGIIVLVVVLFFLNQKPEKFFAPPTNQQSMQTIYYPQVCSNIDLKGNDLENGRCVDNVDPLSNAKQKIYTKDDFLFTMPNGKITLDGKVYSQPAAYCAKMCQKDPKCLSATLSANAIVDPKKGPDARFTCMREIDPIDYSGNRKDPNGTVITWVRDTPKKGDVGTVPAVGAVNTNVLLPADNSGVRRV